MLDLTDLQTYLSFESISTSTQHKGICQATAKWLAKYLAGMGVKTRVIPTKGNSIVYGELGGDPAKKTILVYGHYDVQPAEPINEWQVDPWGGAIKNGAIWGRGSSDNKGQFWCQVLAIKEAMAKKVEIPVNLKLVVEGEEEVGSTQMETFIRQHKKLLKSDIVWIADGSATTQGAPTIDAGLRGCLNGCLTLRGPKKDLHSGSYGGAVANPVNTLATVLSKLADPAGIVKIPGFYRTVKPISPSAKRVMKGEGWSKAEFLRVTGAKALAGEAGYSTQERVGLRPTLQVTGITGGYSGEGFKNIVPKEAVAKLNFRLVAGQDWREIAKLTEQYMAKIIPSEVAWEWEIDNGNDAYLADPDSFVIRVAREVLTKAFGKKTVVRFEGASLPVTNYFAEMITPQVLLSGWAGEMHGVDENLSLAAIERGVSAVAAFWQAIA